jgi:PAS domain S-box-containing protein
VIPGSNDWYRRLVERSPDAVFVSENDRIVFVNPAAMALFGAASPEQMLGRSVSAMFHPGSPHLIREGMARALAGAMTAPVEEKLVSLDGSVIDVEVTSTPLEGDPAQMIQVIVRDITERKQRDDALRESEERLSLAFAGAQEGVWDWNLETGAVVYSSQWKRMLGYGDEELEPHVSAWERLLHPDDRQYARQVHDNVTRGEPTYVGEFRLRHKDGHYVHVLSRGLPIRREPDGPVVRIVGTHFDLSERKRAEAALRESE